MEELCPNRAWTPALYAKLRHLADLLMRGEQADHTLGPTALVHEVWLRLRRSRNAGGLEDPELLGLAAQTMRRVLTDHARRKKSEKRGAGWRRTTLSGKDPGSEPAAFLLDLDQALVALAAVDPELVRVVELRFYAGLSVEEAALALGTSERTVKRRWRFARAWLGERFSDAER